MTTITLKPDDTCFEIADRETILDAALRAGVQLPYGCRGGTCGACKAQKLSGEIDYAGLEPEALTQSEREEGWILCCMAMANTDLQLQAREIETNREIPIKTLPARVMRLEKLAHDVMGLWLKIPATERLQFLPGQYIDILMKDGKARSFSLANAPHDDDFLQLQIRHYAGGHFSEHVFNEMKEKAILRIRGPFGSFYLREDRPQPLIFVAGGTGFAPVKAMIDHLVETQDTRPITLYRGVRALRDLYSSEQVTAWMESHPDFTYVPVLSDPAEEDKWSGETGFVHQVVAKDHAKLTDPAFADVYACGPPVMVHAVRDALVAQGLPADQMYSDAFEFAASTDSTT